VIVLRVSVLAIFAAAIALGVAAERLPFDSESLQEQVAVGTPLADGRSWFCAGGSAPDGPAEAGLEIVNAGSSAAEPVITVMGSKADDIAVHRLTVEPYDRTAVSLAELSDSDWAAAVVEVNAPDVVVDQTHSDLSGLSGADRSSCATRTSSRLMLPAGATRLLAHGEQMTLLLFSPLHNDSITEVVFDADSGPQRLEALVVPGRRLLAVDVTEEVTEAEWVSTVVEVDSGGVVAARVQVRDGELPIEPEPGAAPAESGEAAEGEPAAQRLQGLSVMPAIAEGAVVSVLPTVRSGEGINIVSVANPNRDSRAEVDLEIITDGSMIVAGDRYAEHGCERLGSMGEILRDGDAIRLAPIELTVRGGRTVSVALEDSRLRDLDCLEDFSIVARSLNGLPVAVMFEQRVPFGAGYTHGGVASMGALDAASTRWLAPLESSGSALTVVNPSTAVTATVTVKAAGAGGDSAVALEIGPCGRGRIQSEELFGDRPIAVIEASSPVVVGRHHIGQTSRSLLSGVIAGEVTTLTDLAQPDPAASSEAGDPAAASGQSGAAQFGHCRP